MSDHHAADRGRTARTPQETVDHINADHPCCIPIGDAVALLERTEGPSAFEEDLRSLINRHSCENGSDTPDFILAEYLSRCLDAFEVTVVAREKWYGRRCGGGAAING